ncbi:hypothetical protein AB4Z09_24825 [Rhodococcus sp. TAF43]|nr:hypothetical protein [Rhodococcus sp. W8901]
MGMLTSIGRLFGFEPKDAIPALLDQLLAASSAAHEPPAAQ